MYVRLAFAVAAHLEPEILVVDEVLAVGDAQFQKKCLGKMQNVSSHGRTVIFVSHNMVAIDQLTQHSIFLNNGKLQMYGKTSDVVNAYLGAEKAESLICFNVKNKPRKCHSNQLVRFIEFRFERELPVFNVDEDFQFIARVKANADITDIRTSMTIFANDGTPVGSCFGPAFADFTEGCVVEFRVILPQPRLAPGMYYCGVSVGKGDHITGHVDCDVVLDTLTFEVRPESGDSGTLSLWPRGWGQIVFAPLNQKILLTNE
jgi:lipopolysaccharide transport system ATP-binding protein